MHLKFTSIATVFQNLSLNLTNGTKERSKSDVTVYFGKNVNAPCTMKNCSKHLNWKHKNDTTRDTYSCDNLCPHPYPVSRASNIDVQLDNKLHYRHEVWFRSTELHRKFYRVDIRVALTEIHYLTNETSAFHPSNFGIFNNSWMNSVRGNFIVGMRTFVLSDGGLELKISRGGAGNSRLPEEMRSRAALGLPTLWSPRA